MASEGFVPNDKQLKVEQSAPLHCLLPRQNGLITWHSMQCACLPQAAIKEGGKKGQDIAG